MTERTPRMTRVLPGFEDINRYWDRTRLSMAAKVLPGEFYVSAQDEFVLTTLGSCVSACIWGPGGGGGGGESFYAARACRGL